MIHALSGTTNSVVPEPKGSSPCSQDPTTDPYAEPTESTPHPPASLPKIHSNFRVVSLLQAFPPWDVKT
jgi:hypothetical protein